MILYSQEHKIGLQEFGINIPIYQSKAAKTLEYLMADPVLRGCMDRWLVEPGSGGIDRDDLLRVHESEYVQRLYSEKLEDEIMSTYELIDENGQYYRYNPHQATLPLRMLLQTILEKVSGTWQCCKIALDKGFCFYFGGGMHHAHRDRGKGFCLLNDLVIALRKLQYNQDIEQAWIIDLDAHKGDGTAALTYGDDSITTLSIHMARGWPLDEDKYLDDGTANPSLVPSNIDVAVEPGEEEKYVEKLRKGLGELDINYPRPDIALVVSGMDPFAEDELPSSQELRLSLEQLKDRDMLVYYFLKQRNIPRAYVMAGGYGHRTWEAYFQFLSRVLPDHLGLKTGR